MENKKLKLEKYKNILYMKKSREESIFDNITTHSNITKFDLIISYVYSLKEMKDEIFKYYYEDILMEEGVIYFIYPKVKNKLNHTPIKRDDIFTYLNVDENTGYIENIDYKFNKMLALDENYTLIGIKKIDRNKIKKVNTMSQRVKDYEHKVEDVYNFLNDYPIQQEFYNSLTNGYKKDWARYIFSSKNDATINKRKLEMVKILEKKYKTKQLYLKGEKNG